MSLLGECFEGHMEGRTGQGDSGVLLLTDPLSDPSSHPQERVVEKEEIQVPGALERWLDSQILILQKHLTG